MKRCEAAATRSGVSAEVLAFIDDMPGGVRSR